MLINRLDYKFCWKLFFLPNFLFMKISHEFFWKVKHSIRHISGTVGLIDVKFNGCASAGHWVNYLTSTFALTHDFEFWFFKVKCQNSCISGIVWLIRRKKDSKSIRYWADCMVLPFDHTHDLDLVVSRSKFEIALCEECWVGGGLIDMERKGCKSIIHDHDRDLCLTGVIAILYQDFDMRMVSERS